MELKRTSHAVYDTKYHLVWTPKYRKCVLSGDIREDVEGVFKEISTHYGFDIDAIEIAQEHVHIFVSFPSRYRIARAVEMLKSMSTSVIFEKYPEVKREQWGGEFWEDGYFARTAGLSIIMRTKPRRST